MAMDKCELNSWKCSKSNESEACNHRKDLDWGSKFHIKLKNKEKWDKKEGGNTFVEFKIGALFVLSATDPEGIYNFKIYYLNELISEFNFEIKNEKELLNK